MALNWQPYDDFGWSESQQQPLSTEDRELLEDFAAAVLYLPDDRRQTIWAAASPPGRYAATVIRLPVDLPHRFRAAADAQGVADLGFKIFKAGPEHRGAEREVHRLVPFHRDKLARLPGLPLRRVQRSLWADVARDARLVARGCIIQEWMSGETLDTLHNAPADNRLTALEIREFVSQLVGEIVVPLWSVGTLWWDFRDANFVVNRDACELTMIDVDSLGAYADEILSTPEVWDRREHGRHTALGRLLQMTTRLILAQAGPLPRTLRSMIKNAWTEHLLPVLSVLGRVSVTPAESSAALERFLSVACPAPDSSFP